MGKNFPQSLEEPLSLKLNLPQEQSQNVALVPQESAESHWATKF